jgi:hypothetical protein
MEYRHILINHQLRLEYMDKMALYHPDVMIDVDESASSSQHFIQKYGWSPVNDPCIQHQFYILNKYYSVIAAYTTRGFIKWSIYEGTITSSEFCEFMDQVLRPYVRPFHIGIFDNASYHKTDESLEMIHNVLGGNFLLLMLVYSIILLINL